jgi:hypothetical protein
MWPAPIMLTVESAVEQVLIAYETGARTGRTGPFMYAVFLPLQSSIIIYLRVNFI